MTTTVVAASADDAHEIAAGTVSVVATDPWATEGDSYIALRLTGLAIGQGETVTTAVLDLVLTDSDKNDAEGAWFGEAADDAPAFSATDDDISDRTLTTASVVWTADSLGSDGDTVTTPDLSPILTEIAARTGRVSGDAMVLIYRHDSAADAISWASWDHATYAAPQLRWTVDRAAAIGPAVITVEPQTLGVTPGDASAAITPAAITVTPQTLGVTPGPTTGAISPVEIAVEAQALGVIPGSTEAAIGAAAVTVTAQALGIEPGPASAAISPVVLTVIAMALGIVADPIIVGPTRTTGLSTVTRTEEA